ncbi:hypothetical protein KA012_04065 [Candidatus Woesebacteria bacterium]|nr:hypothetical protein [Candidatus Woesebacteria bacterium]
MIKTQTLFTLASLVIFSAVLSGCTLQSVPSATESPLVSPTIEPESSFVPVNKVDPLVNATATEAVDQTLQDTDQMLKDMQQDSFTDLPSDLGK